MRLKAATALAFLAAVSSVLGQTVLWSGMTGRFTDGRFSPDGRFIVAMGSSSSIFYSGGQFVSAGYSRSTDRVPYTWDGNLVYSATGYTFDATTFAPLGPLPSHNEQGDIAQVIPGTGRVAVISNIYTSEPTIAFRDRSTWAVKASYRSVQKINRMRAAGMLLITSGPEARRGDGRLVWSYSNGGDFDVSPDGRWVASFFGGRVSLLDAATGRVVWTLSGLYYRGGLRFAGNSAIVGLQPDPSGAYNRIRTIDVATGKFRAGTATTSAAKILDVNPDGRTLLLSRSSESISYASALMLNEIDPATGYSVSARTVGQSDETIFGATVVGNVVVVHDQNDGTATLRDLTTGAFITRWDVLMDSLPPVIADDGQVAASSTVGDPGNPAVNVHNASTGQVLATIFLPSKVTSFRWRNRRLFVRMANSQTAVIEENPGWKLSRTLAGYGVPSVNGDYFLALASAQLTTTNLNSGAVVQHLNASPGAIYGDVMHDATYTYNYFVQNDGTIGMFQSTHPVLYGNLLSGRLYDSSTSYQLLSTGQEHGIFVNSTSASIGGASASCFVTYRSFNTGYTPGLESSVSVVNIP